MMLFRLLACAAFVNLFLGTDVLAQQPASGADFYVAPDGSDSNPGTSAAPFASIAGAQKAVLGAVQPVDLHQLLAGPATDGALTLKPGNAPQVIWISYQK